MVLPTVGGADGTVLAVGLEVENDDDDDDDEYGVDTADGGGEYGTRVGVGVVAGTSVRAIEGFTVGSTVGAAVGI